MDALDSTAQGRLILWKHGSHPDIGYCAGSQAFADDVIELLAENAALKADAERYESLRLMLIGAISHASAFGDGNVAASVIAKFLVEAAK